MASDLQPGFGTACAPDFFSHTYVSLRPSVSAVHWLSSFWSAVSQHMDSWTRHVPHPPQSQQSVLEHIQTRYRSWLTHTHSHTHLSYFAAVNARHIHQTKRDMFTEEEFPGHRYKCFHYFIFNTDSKLLLNLMGFFAELEPTSVCDRANYFPSNFCVSWML